MRPALALAWTLALAASAAGLGLSARRAWLAHHSAARARELLARTQAQTRELAALRAAAPDPSRQPRPGSGLGPRLTSILAARGLPASALSILAPEPIATFSAAGNQTQLKRQRAALTLSGPTLPQLGAFLEAWRAAEPAWTVTRIDLSPLPGSAPPAGGDLPLKAGLVLEAMLADAPAPKGPP